jgi:hypothetical protein
MVRGSAPFGGSNGLVCLFHGGHRYCHNGGMAFAHAHGVGLAGVQDGDDGPLPRSLEQAVMQGKVRRGP